MIEKQLFLITQEFNWDRDALTEKNVSHLGILRKEELGHLPDKSLEFLQYNCSNNGQLPA